MKYLILAGGYATRLWPISEHRAKPLLLLNGKTILAHILELLPTDAETILLTNQKFATDFETEINKLNRHKQTKIFLEDSYADGEKLGALGAVAAAIEEYNIQESIMVLAGDNILPALKIANLSCHDNESVLAVRAVDELWQAQKFGVVEMDDSKNENKKVPVLGFEEKPEQPKSKMVSTGFMSFGADLLPHIHDYAKEFPDALGGIFPYLLEQRVSVLATKVPGKWFDIGSFETYLTAHKELQEKPIILGEKVTQSGNTFSGKVYIGNNCHIKNCTLHDTIVYPGTKLEDCIISRSVIDKDCNLFGLDLNQKLIRAGMDFRG